MLKQKKSAPKKTLTPEQQRKRALELKRQAEQRGKERETARKEQP